MIRSLHGVRGSRRAALVALLPAAAAALGCTSGALVDVAMSASPRPDRTADLHVGDRVVLAGDTHCHVHPPDAPSHVSRGLARTVALAEREGLDFVVLTPHVRARFYEREEMRAWTAETQADLARAIAALRSRVLLIRGLEYTDPRYGHVGLSFADVGEVLREVPPDSPPSRFFERWVSHGGVVTVNHPASRALRNAPFRALRWDMSFRGFSSNDVPEEMAWITEHAQAVETFNASVTHLRDQFVVGDEERSLREVSQIVDTLARSGRRHVAPVGGTDSHGDWLRPTTYVLARERTAEAVRDAITSGRTCVRAPAACTLEVRAVGGDFRGLGEHVSTAGTSAPGLVEARARGGDVTFVVNGERARGDDGALTRLAVPQGRCSVVRAIVGRSWSAPVFVNCPALR